MWARFVRPRARVVAPTLLVSGMCICLYQEACSHCNGDEKKREATPKFLRPRLISTDMMAYIIVKGKSGFFQA
jgi:hypothetical protein